MLKNSVDAISSMDRMGIWLVWANDYTRAIGCGVVTLWIGKTILHNFPQKRQRDSCKLHVYLPPRNSTTRVIISYLYFLFINSTPLPVFYLWRHYMYVMDLHVLTSATQMGQFAIKTKKIWQPFLPFFLNLLN